MLNKVVNIAKQGWSGVLSVHVTGDNEYKLEKTCGRGKITKEFKITNIVPRKFNKNQIEAGKHFLEEAEFSLVDIIYREQPKALLEGDIEGMFLIKERDKKRESR